MGVFDSIANLATSASQSSGGSSQGGQNSAYNMSDSFGNSNSNSWSMSRTFGSEATAKSYAEALRAHMRQQDFYDQAKAYNSYEAELQRQYNKLMADTTYQRSIEDMKKAGINPILAASFGLSADSVNSGAAASVSSPSTFMGQTFPDQVSASGSNSSSNSGSHSEGASEGSSWGSSWQNSTSGLSTFLDQMNLTTQGLIDMIQSGQVVSNVMDTMSSGENSVGNEGSANWHFDANGGWKGVVGDIIRKAQKGFANAFKDAN